MITTIEHPGLMAIHCNEIDDADEARDLALDALEQRLRVTVMRKSVGISALVFSAKRINDKEIYVGTEHGNAKHRTAEAAVSDGMRKFKPAFTDDRDDNQRERDDRN